MMLEYIKIGCIIFKIPNKNIQTKFFHQKNTIIIWSGDNNNNNNSN